MKFVILLMFSLYGYFNPAVVHSTGSIDPFPNHVESFELGKKAEFKMRNEITAFAKKFVGKQYRYAAVGPNSFDCSGYTSFIYHHFNVNLDRSSKLQSKQGRRKRISQLNPADLVFFGNLNKVKHVGIVLEASKDKLLIVHCSSSKGVIIEDVYHSDYWKNKLLFGKDVIKN